MTIALGLRCVDGFVLCADSLETDGVTKRYVNKLWIYEVQEEWGIAIASAGEADLADSFNDGLEEILGNSDFDEARLLAKLRTAIRSVRVSYKEAEFGFLAVVYGRPKLYSKLFRVMGESSHLGPVRKYQSLGIGGGVATFLASQLYRDSLSVQEAVRLGAFIIDRVKDHTEGCGGPTTIVSFGGVGNPDYTFKLWGRQEVEAIESELPGSKLTAALDQFWEENNPAPLFGRARSKDGGSSRWIRTAKLNTG